MQLCCGQVNLIKFKSAGLEGIKSTINAVMMIFKHTVWLLLFLIGFAWNGKAQKTENLEKSLLWKVTGNGIKPSYIYGTIHIIGEDDFFLTTNTKRCFKKTKCLVLEIDMSNLVAMSMKMLSLAPMKGNKKLADFLSEEDYTLIKDYFEKESKNSELKMLPFAVIENWQPMLLEAFLYRDVIEKPVREYEMELLGMAKKKKRKMKYGGLETVEDQMNAFSTISYEDQATGLLNMVKEIQSQDEIAVKEFEQMVNLYKEQDIEGLLEVITVSDKIENPEEFKRNFINRRNRNWIPKIGEFAKKQATFFAVGAGHLAGEEGLISLLKNEGYKLTPLY